VIDGMSFVLPVSYVPKKIRQQRQRTVWGTGMKPKLDATRTCFGKSAENKKLTLFIKKETRISFYVPTAVTLSNVKDPDFLCPPQ
jgi:hypothetical protein